MTISHRGQEDPNRLVELEQQLETHISELFAEAADAGYTTAEVLMAFKVVCDRQHTALAEDPDPAEDLDVAADIAQTKRGRIDIRDARFYVIDDDDGSMVKDAEPLQFDPAYQKACALAQNGVRVKVLYTEEASQIQITRFVNHGIVAELVSGA